MSLIFEALKKLERERDTSERGFQVIAQTPWPARSRALRMVLLSVAAGALAGAGAWGSWTWLSSRRGASVPAPAAGTMVAQPPARPLPPPIWESAPPSAVPAGVSPAPAAAPPAAASAPPTAAAAVAAPTTEPAGSPAPAKGPPELRLEAISAQDGEPVAIINGQLVRQGETVEGALVTWIGPDSVEIELDGKRRVLRF